MSADADTRHRGGRVLVSDNDSTNSKIYHTDPNCKHLDGVPTTSVRRETLTTWRECAACAPHEVRRGTVPGSKALGTCPECGGALDAEKRCGFCERYDRELASAPDLDTIRDLAHLLRRENPPLGEVATHE